MLKEPIIRDKRHLREVAKLPCLKCRTSRRSQAAHLHENKGGKMGAKHGDNMVVPLCADGPGAQGCHSKYDQYKEVEYWKEMEARAKVVAQKLYQVSGDTLEMLKALAWY